MFAVGERHTMEENGSMPMSLFQVYAHLTFRTRDRIRWLEDSVRERVHGYLAATARDMGAPFVVAGIESGGDARLQRAGLGASFPGLTPRAGVRRGFQPPTGTGSASMSLPA